MVAFGLSRETVEERNGSTHNLPQFGGEMKYKIELEIECGEETCASEPGKFCRWFGSKSFGRKPV